MRWSEVPTGNITELFDHNFTGELPAQAEIFLTLKLGFDTIAI